MRRETNLEGSKESREMAGGRTWRKERASLMLWPALVWLASTSLSASEIAKTFRIRVGSERVRVVVPKKFEPLLPGSVYPNRRRAIPARSCPVVVVEKVAPLVSFAEPFLLERGFLVVEMEKPDPARIDLLLDELSRRAEANAARASLLVWNGSTAIESARVDAAAIFDPRNFRAPAGVESRCLPLALFFRSPASAPGEEFRTAISGRPECVSEKWYRGEKGFPPEAFRDAAEWLADLR